MQLEQFIQLSHPSYCCRLLASTQHHSNLINAQVGSHLPRQHILRGEGAYQPPVAGALQQLQ